MLQSNGFDNSPPDGHGVLEIVSPEARAGDARRFLPLRYTSLRGHVTGPVAALELEQKFGFGGELEAPDALAVLETRYRFPLPGDAAVQSVTVRFGEVEISAVLQARTEAEAAYAEARAEGRQAILATREADDVFTLQISGLRADEPVTVVTRFVQLARADGLAWVLRVPLTTVPRYVRRDERETRAGQANPYAVLRDPGHRFLLDVTVAGAAAVSSPTHELAQQTDADGVIRVRLAAGEVLPDRDLLLRFQSPQTEQLPSLRLWAFDDTDASAGSESGEQYVLALVTPPAGETATALRETILLVDHSGSMSGPKWQAADWAVERFLNDLGPHDSFALGIFHSTTRWFRPAPSSANRETVQSAVRWLKAQTESGGTELGVALEQALELPRASDAPQEAQAGGIARHLLIVTDAQVSDSGRILRLADGERRRPQSARRRISVLCIDSAPNAGLASDLAERGGGFSRFLTSDPEAEDISTALDGFLADFAAPVLVGARLVFNRAHALGTVSVGKPVDSGAVALDLGDLPTGCARWVTARLSGGRAPLQVRLESGQGVAAECSAAPASAAIAAPAVKAIFGARRIQILESLVRARYDLGALRVSLGELGYDPDLLLSPESRQRVYAENMPQDALKRLGQLILEESLRYGVASTEVGFVATRKEAGKVVTQQVDVANALAAGWSEQFVTYAPLPPLSAPADASFMSRLHAAPPPPSSSRTSKRVYSPPDAISAPLRYAAPDMNAAPDMDAAPVATGQQTLFKGAPAGGETILFDSAQNADIALPKSTIFTGLLLQGSLPDDVGGILLLYVGDLAEPRARVRLADLVRSGLRPLNVRRRPGDVVRLVLQADKPLPSFAVSIIW